MNQDYTDIIQHLSQQLSSAIQEREIDLSDSVSQLDGFVGELLRIMGLKVMSLLLNAEAEQAIKEKKKTGSVIHRRLKAKYSVIFGVVELDSPYLWNKQEHQGNRPVQDKLGIKHRDFSKSLTRILTDFGAEESFEQAGKPHGSLIFREGRQIVDQGRYKSRQGSSATAKSFAVED